MKLRHKLLDHVANLPVRRPWTVLAVAAGLVVVSFAVMTIMGLGVETSRVALWPDDNELQKRFEAYQDLFGSPFQVIVVVEGDDPAHNKTAAARVAQRIGAEVPEVADVFYKVDLDALMENAPLYLPTDRLAALAQRLTELAGTGKEARPAAVGLDGVVGVLDRLNQALGRIEEGDTTGLSALQDNAKELVGLGAPVLDELERWVTEPDRRELGIVESIGAELGVSEGLDPDGFLIADGGRMVLLMCQPREEDDSLAYLRSIVDPVRRIAAEESETADGVTIGVTGMPAFVTDELEVAHHDLRFVTALSAVGVLLLFLIAYGSLMNTVFIGLTLLLGIALDLAFTTLAVGRVNLISSLFVAVLLGLGIDYGIQLINRFQEERRRGEEVPKAVRISVIHAGEGVLTGGITTAVAFFMMGLGEFKPLKELGLIAGAGILFILAASFFVLPALLVLRGRRAKAGEKAKGIDRLGGGWLLPTLPFRGKRAAFGVVGVGLTLTVLLALPIRPITFSNDLIAMLPTNAPSVKWLRRLESTGMFTSAFNASIATSLDEVRERAARFSKLDTVSRVLSIDRFLPRDGAAKADSVRAVRAAARRMPALTLRTPDVDIPKLREALDELAGYLELDLPLTLKTQGMAGLAPDVSALAKRVHALDERIASLPPAEVSARLGRLQLRLSTLLSEFQAFVDSDVEQMTAHDLPADIAGMFYRHTADGDRYLLRIYPSGDINDDAFMPRFLAETRGVDAEVTGYPVNYYEFALVMQSDFRMAFLYAVIAIIFLLALDLRRVRDVLMALIPLVMGGVWMVGSMNLLGIEYNLANIMAIPLIVGIGVAYGVYIIHRHRELDPPSPRTVVRTTGKAVVFSALTTMVSFGAMSVASHRGAAGLGLTLLLGIAFCLVSSIGFLPALLRLVPRGRGGREEG